MTSIIISTKNRLLYLKELIKSIQEYTTDYEIIVVDDVSIDGTKEWTEGQDFGYIYNEKSVPVAVAWNQGAEVAQGKYLVFLNDDMLVTQGWIDEQIKMYEEKPLIGSLAFKVFDDEGNVQSRGHSFRGFYPYLPSEDTITVDYSDHPFVEKKVWERVGGFDVMGQIYYEDAAFGVKLLSYGYFNYYNPKAILFHQTVGLRLGGDSEKKLRFFNESVEQQRSKVNFYLEWGNYLKNRK